jgi:hypothetical protein
MLASSLSEVRPPDRVCDAPDIREATVTNSPVTEESAEETVKTIAQGELGVPVDLW